MEVENTSRKVLAGNKQQEEEDNAQLPGFRFHPTDEELVGFYLRRKVDKKPIKLELIKQADIYKYDPWDLPSMSTGSSQSHQIRSLSFFFHFWGCGPNNKTSQFVMIDYFCLIL